MLQGAEYVTVQQWGTGHFTRREGQAPEPKSQMTVKNSYHWAYCID